MRQRITSSRSILALLVLFAVVVPPLSSPEPARAATTYHVSPTGSDAGNGTESAPWKTFTHSLRQLQPGDTLIAHGGTYVERVDNPPLAPASPSAPIIVTAAAGERPVIQGVLWLNGADHWSFSGINVTWDDSTGKRDEHMVKLTNGVGWRFSNAEVWGARSFAAILVYSSTESEPRDWSITNNCIHDTHPTNDINNDHLIYVNSGLSGSGGLIEGNLMFNATHGNGVKLGGSSSSSGGASGVTVRNNTIYNTHQSVFVAWGANDNLVEGNLLIDVSDDYANIRAFELTGGNNLARANAGGASSGMFRNDDGYQPVLDGGGNIWPVQPAFDSTQGCSGFNPTDPVAMQFGHLSSGTVPSPPPGDSFDDDNASPHEDAIEKIAAAGITNGCGPRLYCPSSYVTRAQMASFIARALDL